MNNITGKKLLISIPGTTGPGDVMRSFDSVAALEGYHAISIDYPNNRNTATFINSTDKEAFNKFRQELDFGTPASDSVDVDSLNSIINRITKLVIYLAKTRPAEGWNNFLDDDKIRWELVTLAGHSQGAGHVSYIAHAFKVHKVIMLSGPQDFLANFDMPAPWLSADSKTPYNSFYSLLHDNDAYNTQRQIRNDLAAMHADSSVIYRFQNTDTFPKRKRIFISEITVKQNVSPQNSGQLNHMASIMPLHSEVWKWLLKD
jgi:pimeloyl-ACP methyl ester carboxylesterase